MRWETEEGGMGGDETGGGESGGGGMGDGGDDQ